MQRRRATAGSDLPQRPPAAQSRRRCSQRRRSRRPRAATCWDWRRHGVHAPRRHLRQRPQRLLVSGYSWHLPFTWTPERRAQLNKNAWGGGLVRDHRGSRRRHAHGVLAGVSGFAQARAVQPRLRMVDLLGRAQRRAARARATRLMLVQRPDIVGGIPFPAVLPIVSLRYQNVTLSRDLHPDAQRRHQPRQHVLRRSAADRLE